MIWLLKKEHCEHPTNPSWNLKWYHMMNSILRWLFGLVGLVCIPAGLYVINMGSESTFDRLMVCLIVCVILGALTDKYSCTKSERNNKRVLREMNRGW
jgi:hypothetical protein